MNLCYSLHYYKIASCILNWSVLPKDDRKLRKIVNIPEEETIVLIVVVGEPSKHFDIAVSKRQNIEDFFTIH